MAKTISLEQRNKISNSMKGNTNGHGNKGRIGVFLGKKHSLESRNKMRESRLKALKNGLIVWNKGLSSVFDSRIIAGNKFWNWKGGITKINKLIRTHPKNINWIKTCMKRDKYTCQKCKQLGGELEVHHIVPVSLLIKKNKIITKEQIRTCKELWNLKNGITLCKLCHVKIDKYRGING